MIQSAIFIEEALFASVNNVNFDMESLLEMVRECKRKMSGACISKIMGTPSAMTL